MRYLVYGEKKKQIFLWEESKTHTAYAVENGMDLDKVSSVGYIYYNPENKMWLLRGAITWNLFASVPSDKQRVLAFLKKNYNQDTALIARLSEQWHQIQQQNPSILRKNPVLAEIFKQTKTRE